MMIEITAENMAEIFRALRGSSTQREFAHISGISPSYWSEIESGHKSRVSSTVLFKAIAASDWKLKQKKLAFFLIRA